MIWIGFCVVFLGVLTYLRVLGRSLRLGVAVGTFVVFVLMTVPQLRLDPKLWGVVLMALSTTIFVALPWLDQSPVKSMRYRPGWHKALLGLFVIAFLVLGYLGIQPPSPGRTLVAQVCATLYFGFFFLMPWWSRMGTFKPVPTRVTFAAH